MEIEQGLVGGGITAAVVGLIYGVKKMMERSSCHSDTSCCQVDIAALVEDQVRQKTERDQGKLIEIVLGELRKGKKEESVSEAVFEDNTPKRTGHQL